MAKSNGKQKVSDKVADVPQEPAYVPSELVIKEVMVQKGVTREEALKILLNPVKPK